MNTKEAWLLVIKNEMKAQKLYAFLAEKCPHAHANIFQNLIPMEKFHEQKMRELFLKQFPGEEIIIEFKNTNKHLDEDFSDPKNVYDFAINRENKAYEAYVNLANEALDPELKKLLLQFSEEEKNHADLLFGEIEKLSQTMVWYDESELSGFMDF